MKLSSSYFIGFILGFILGIFFITSLSGPSSVQCFIVLLALFFVVVVIGFLFSVYEDYRNYKSKNENEKKS